ncbi:MAG: phospholipid carrier-dependent glycosyltransferase [Gemmatimonadales bacterium]
MRWALPVIAGITLLAALLRFRFLAAEDLWFDEVFSVVLSSQDLGELFRRSLADQTNPPGFYLLLGGWMRLGGVHAGWLRALPALAGTLTVPAVAALARALRMRWPAALLAALLAAVSPLLLAMSLEVRAYALLALASTLSLTLGVRLARPDGPPRYGVATLAAVNLVLVSLHYFGALVVVAGVVATWWTNRSRLRAAVLAALPAGVALAGWIGVVIVAFPGRRVGVNAGWIPLPGLREFGTFSSNAVGTFGTGWGMFAVNAVVIAALLAAVRHARGGRAAGAAPDTGAADVARLRARWLLVALLLPVATVFAVSEWSSRSIWLARYLIIALPPLWLLVANAAMVPTGVARTAAVAAIAGWACLAGPLAELTRVHKPAWSLVVRSLAGGRPVTVCVNEQYVGLPLEFYALDARLHLRVLDFHACGAAREGAWALVRPETESSLNVLRGGGAVVGPVRGLKTALPDADLYALRWTAP